MSVASTGHAATAPANDLIENATPISTLPFSATQDSTDATTSQTDPPPACNQGSTSFSLWYVYTAPTDGRLKATTSSSVPFAAPAVTVYSGSPGSLTHVGCAGQAVTLAAGTTYYVRLSQPGCCFGTFTLNIAVPPPPPPNDLIDNATPISTLPFSATQDSTDATTSQTDPPPACNLASTSFSLWYVYTAPTDSAIKIQTSSSSLFVAPAVTVYSGSSGALDQVGCGPIVPVTAGVSYYIRLSLSGCCFGTFTIGVRETHPPANDRIENATVIDPLPFSTVDDGADATRSSSDPPSGCIGGDVPTLWYTFTAHSDGLVQAITSGAFSTFLSVYAGQPDNLAAVGCTSGGAATNFGITNGTTYYLAVTALQRDRFTLDVQHLLDVTVPHDFTVEATQPDGAVVGYSATATLPDGTPTTMACSPNAGSTMAVGDTTVTCQSGDGAGHTLIRTFVVHVADTTAPAVTVPAGTITADATRPAGTAVSYTATATDAVDLDPVTTCDPPSQGMFPIGHTPVHCVASDSSGNRSDPAQFTVYVKGAAEQLQDLTNVVTASNAPVGLRTSLLATLADARRALANGKTAAACGALRDFTGLARAQAGKKLTAALADLLTDDAARITGVIACPRK